jgi:general transcription factor 3C polypeptide 5 (transcription factor C subunit 1)
VILLDNHGLAYHERTIHRASSSKSLTRVQIVKADTPTDGVSLYLRPDDPMCAPIVSHNATTNNLLIRITAPKRTGRKRKRGSQEPFHDSNDDGNTDRLILDGAEGQMTHASPSRILRTLQENSKKYSVEVVGKITHTQRFRGTC